MRTIKQEVSDKNIGEVKRICWVYLITALLYSFSGPIYFNDKFVLGTILSGLLIFINPPKDGIKAEREKIIVCWLILLIMVFYAVYIIYGSLHREMPHLDGPSSWIANRFFFLFGLAFFMPPLLEHKINTDRRKDGAIIIGCLSMFVAFYLFKIERLEICHELGPWYSPAIMFDDVLLSVAIGLLVAVLTVKTRPADEKHLVEENCPKGSTDVLS